jgi:hypothetical protein
LKYGKSFDFPRRELKEHRKNFDVFNVLHIEDTEHVEIVENKIKLEFKAKRIDRQRKIKNKNQTELVAINAVIGVESCINIIKQVSMNVKMKSPAEYENKINKLTQQLEHCKERLINKTEQFKESRAQHKLKDDMINDLIKRNKDDD